MSYSPTTWVEGVTKLGPTNMNKIEQGIVDAMNAAGGGGGGGIQTTLSTSAVSGSTTMKYSSSSGLQLGQVMAHGVGTSTCEVRRIIAITGATATLNAALKWTHDTGEVARNIESPVPITFWGAVPGDSTVDSFRNLSNMFLDIQSSGLTYPVIGTGYGSTHLFYSSKPLWCPDGTRLIMTSLSPYSPFAIDATSGLWLYNNEPLQHFLHAAGQFGVVSSFDAGANSVTFDADPGASQGEAVAFYVREGQGTLPTGLEEGRTYYCIEASGSTRTLCMDKWGTTPVNFTDTGSGEIVYWSPGNTRLYTNHVYLHGGAITYNIRGLNGLYAQLQQQSNLTDLRIEQFPMWGATISGQQSIWVNPYFNQCGAGGMRIAGGKYISCFGGVWEHSDINFQSLDVNIGASSAAPSTAGSTNNLISLGHFESPGFASRLFQTITISGTPTAGTFTIGTSSITSAALSYTATSADVQAQTDIMFGAGNTVVTGGALPGASIQIAFQGNYAWGYAPTVRATNSITGGSFSVNAINPSGRQISMKGGQEFHLQACVDSTGTKPDGTAITFFVVEGAGATSVNNVGYTLESIFSPTNTDYFVEDPLRLSITRVDSSQTGAAANLSYYSASSRHGSTVGRNWWLTGDGGRYVAFATAGAPTLHIQGSSAQTSELFKLAPGSAQSTAALAAYDNAGVVQTTISTSGWLTIGAASAGPQVRSFTASPQGVIAAPVGSICFNTGGGASTTLYVREAATGSTSGWVAK